MALLTASKFGLPKSIIARAEELSKHWDTNNAVPCSYESRSDAIDDKTVGQLLESTTANAQAKSIFIPRDFMPPPSLEGSSCVYIIQMGDDSSNMKYYVGETDSLSRRLSEHRSKGDEWATSSTIAIQVEEGKSSARSLERKMIQLLAQKGFDIVNRQRQ